MSKNTFITLLCLIIVFTVGVVGATYIYYKSDFQQGEERRMEANLEGLYSEDDLRADSMAFRDQRRKIETEINQISDWCKESEQYAKEHDEYVRQNGLY